MALFDFRPKQHSIEEGSTSESSAALNAPPSRLGQSFILEPILTPSGLVDSLADDTPDLDAVTVPPLDIESIRNDADFDLPDVELPTVDLGESEPLEFTIFGPETRINGTEEFEFSEAIALSNRESIDSEFDDEFRYDFPEETFSEWVNPQLQSGFFIVGETGEVTIDYLFDGGRYQGELAIFSLDGMDPNSEDFIHEAARRALSGSEEGHIVISDRTEGARFDGTMPKEGSWNAGDYQGAKTFQMRPGDEFGFMLVPNGRVQEVMDNPAIAGTKTPLFSLATANPDDMFAAGQVVDVYGDGNTFVFEDQRVDQSSDSDYNDIVFHVRGAKGQVEQLSNVIDPQNDWRINTDMGKALVAYTEAYITPDISQPIEDGNGEAITIPQDYPLVEMDFTDPGVDNGQGGRLTFPASAQPLVGIVDTGFSNDNPYLDFSSGRITPGYDWIDGDGDPFLQLGQGDQHGTLVSGLIGASDDNDFVQGINSNAPLWLGRAVGSDQWAKSLTEFVDAARASQQPNAIVNLSFDLTRYDADGTSTRFELTQEEWNALKYAHENKVLVVAAAGSDGSAISALGRASLTFDNILTVGSAMNTNPDVAIASGFERGTNSNTGMGLDIMAEGGTSDNPLLSTLGDGLGTISGSSSAAAKMSGSASLVWAANPNLSYQQVIDILKRTATDLNQLKWDPETGNGLLNMAAAIHLAKATVPKQAMPNQPILPPIFWDGGENAVARERPTGSFNYPIRTEYFTGKVAPIGAPFYGVSYRKSPNLNDRWGPGIAAQSNTQLSFNAWTYGEPVKDWWTGKPDALWFRYQANGRDYWVPSAYIYGYPPSRPPILPPTSGSGTSLPTSQLQQLLSKARLTVDEIRICRQLIAQLPASSRPSLYKRLQYKVPYFNQRDNASDGGSIGDVMCNLTTLASCLTYLGIINPSPSQQFEDYLESVLRSNPAKYPSNNGLNARYWWSNLSKLANSFGVASSGIQKFPGFSATNQQFFKDFVKKYWEPALNQGKAIMAGVSNTPSGHIVKVLDIDWNRGGIVVDDPYGAANTAVSKGYRTVNTKARGSVNTQRGTDEGGVGNDNFWSWSYCAKVFGETWYLLLG